MCGLECHLFFCHCSIKTKLVVRPTLGIREQGVCLKVKCSDFVTTPLILVDGDT